MSHRQRLALLFLAVAALSHSQISSAQTVDEVDQAAPHATLAQLMRGLLYPNSEIIFDAQSEDPEQAAIEAASDDPFLERARYAGWEGVANAGLVLSEAATLILVQGRQCENGQPVPVENGDFRNYASNLVETGQAVYEAAQSQSMDAMLDVTGQLTEACAACHEVYRDPADVGEEVMRCMRFEGE